MDRLATMEVFARVAEAGSFVAAAVRLKMSPAMVTRYVMDLENRLGTRLINRTTRRLQLTESGAAYLERCQQVLHEIEEMDLAVASEVSQPRGVLKVNAPLAFGVRHLPPCIREYQTRFPAVTVDLALTDRFVDLIEEGADLALRVGAMADSSLVARGLFPVRVVVCASPAYLARHGKPQTPEELGAHNCLGYTYARGGDKWEFHGPDGPRAVAIRGSLRANNGDVLCQAAIDGLGLVMQPTFIVGEAIAAGLLVPVLGGFQTPEINAYAVFPSRKFLSAKVRTFVDLLAERFGPEPYWDQWNKAASLSGSAHKTDTARPRPARAGRSKKPPAGGRK
jgi:DNA-binding transcriptional LysR family regulator